MWMETVKKKKVFVFVLFFTSVLVMNVRVKTFMYYNSASGHFIKSK